VFFDNISYTAEATSPVPIRVLGIEKLFNVIKEPMEEILVKTIGIGFLGRSYPNEWFRHV
jgi:hypothetical protein